MGNLNKNQITLYSRNSVKDFIHITLLLHSSICVSLISFFSSYSRKVVQKLQCLSAFYLFLYFPSFFFFILILCLVLFIFFSSMCHSRCCPNVVGQPSVPSGYSFLKVIMNKDFWGLLSYFDKLSIALNVTISSGLL